MGILGLAEAGATAGAFAFGAESDCPYAGTKAMIASIKAAKKLARQGNVVFLKVFLQAKRLEFSAASN
jgi:hypothetical protein